MARMTAQRRGTPSGAAATPPPNVDAYIEGAPPAARPMLRELRRLVFEAAPSVTEKVSYGMPSYEHRGRSLVHFAAARTHVGVYGLVHVEDEVPGDLVPYLQHRSTLRFPLGRPLPTEALAAAIRRKAGTV